MFFPLIRGIVWETRKKQEKHKMSAEKKMMLVLLAGQSNMAGRGEIEPEDREEIPGLLMINRNFEWVPAVEPVTADRPFAGVGPGRTFGRLLLEANPGGRAGADRSRRHADLRLEAGRQFPVGSAGTSLRSVDRAGHRGIAAGRFRSSALASGRN